ncbi:class I SAM-dependent methyltransferase [Yoonia sp. R2331]|uniref:class I SAM-dependent DNA methyltransferase n=1 Tax=Yoonia sp. R2331 TaxID=3237238 RepID=UPI0034E4AB9E
MTDKKDVLKPQLWMPRPVEETMQVYADWAATYDADVSARGYHTPARIADAVAQFADLKVPMLDYGCGTGLSGLALRAAGFTALHGTDISPEMLEQAEKRGVYDKVWLSEPGALTFGRGAYDVVLAVGVVSLGAAPADMLAPLIDKLNTGGLLAFSYNDPTLADASYIAALDDAVAAGTVEVIFREHGPHLDDVGMKSDVIILRRR